MIIIMSECGASGLMWSERVVRVGHRVVWVVGCVGSVWSSSGMVRRWQGVCESFYGMEDPRVVWRVMWYERPHVWYGTFCGMEDPSCGMTRSVLLV